MEEPIKNEPNPYGGVSSTHPAFGVATVSRAEGTARSLFQSDLRHNSTIRLSLHRAERVRDLDRDWTHPTEELVEVEMSLAQWGALVSSIGIGSGVPVTIRRTEQVVRVPSFPHEPRIAQNINEVTGAVGRILERAEETLAELQEAVEQKQGVRAVRDALRNHTASIANARSNSAFAVTSMAEAAENIVAQARADIETQILNAAHLTGTTASIDAPTLPSAATQPAVDR